MSKETIAPLFFGIIFGPVIGGIIGGGIIESGIAAAAFIAIGSLAGWKIGERL
tara:strand:- start:753 stop:911 length:159 start_codon:yes stop_codon:yes gene_type:complete